MRREISPGATGIGLGQAGCENDGVHAARWKPIGGVLRNRAMKRRCAKYRVARETAGLNSIDKHDQLHNHVYRFTKWWFKAENTGSLSAPSSLSPSCFLIVQIAFSLIMLSTFIFVCILYLPFHHTFISFYFFFLYSRLLTFIRVTLYLYYYYYYYTFVLRQVTALQWRRKKKRKIVEKFCSAKFYWSLLQISFVRRWKIVQLRTGVRLVYQWW